MTARAPVGEKVSVLDFIGPNGGQMRLQVGQFAVNLDGDGVDPRWLLCRRGGCEPNCS